MTTGRTVWQAQDAGWWRRDRVVELGTEFGSAGPAVANWLECEAKAQNTGGTLKAGYRAIARGAFIDDVDQVERIVRHAVDIGFLKDFDEGARTFVARISAFADDQGRGRADLRRERGVRDHIPDRLRRLIFERDESRCQRCGSADEPHLDHIFPWALGGPSIQGNLQVLCGPCNRAKGMDV